VVNRLRKLPGDAASGAPPDNLCSRFFVGTPGSLRSRFAKTRNNKSSLTSIGLMNGIRGEDNHPRPFCYPAPFPKPFLVGLVRSAAFEPASGAFLMARLRHESPSGKVELPMTPMLDMTFQLMAFFLLTFQASSALEGKMEFGIPPEAAGRSTMMVPIPAGEVCPLPDDETRLTIVVRSLRDGVNDGNISALIVQSPQGEVAVHDLNDLRQNLKQRQADAGKSQVRIAADCRLKYACVMDVMDACVQSGFANVGFAVPPDLGLN
jgi:biopolymer transport protein ExbD